MQRSSHYPMWHRMADYPKYFCALMRGPINRTANRRDMQENLLAIASVVPDGAFSYGENPTRDFATLWESRYAGYGSRTVINGIAYRAYFPSTIRSLDGANNPYPVFDAIMRAVQDVLLPNNGISTYAGSARTEVTLNKAYSHVLICAPRTSMTSFYKAADLSDAYVLVANNMATAANRIDSVRRIFWFQNAAPAASPAVQWGVTIYVPESEIEPFVPDPVTHMYMIPNSTWYTAPTDAMANGTDFTAFILDRNEFAVDEPDGTANFPNLSRIRLRFK